MPPSFADLLRTTDRLVDGFGRLAAKRVPSGRPEDQAHLRDVKEKAKQTVRLLQTKKDDLLGLHDEQALDATTQRSYSNFLRRMTLHLKNLVHERQLFQYDRARHGPGRLPYTSMRSVKVKYTLSKDKKKATFSFASDDDDKAEAQLDRVNDFVRFLHAHKAPDDDFLLSPSAHNYNQHVLVLKSKGTLPAAVKRILRVAKDKLGAR